MIQILAPSNQLQEIVLLEMQGKVSIPPKVLQQAREQQREKQQEQQEKEKLISGTKHPRHESEINNSTLGINTVNSEETMVLELPLGCVENDSRNEKRCSLHIGTLVVDGSKGKYREPLLVLRRRDQNRKKEEKEESSCVKECSLISETPLKTSSSYCLLQDWLKDHPEELTLDAAAAAAITITNTDNNNSNNESNTNNVPMKVYELVGIVERYVHLNSKPMRTFS